VSIYACDLHGARVPGALETAYPSLLDHGARYSRRVRLCVGHMSELLEDTRLGLQPMDFEADGETATRCSGCGNPPPDGTRLAALFVTTYRKGEERADYFAQLCHPCADAVVTRLALSV
jgi:hypothetical protein